MFRRTESIPIPPIPVNTEYIQAGAVSFGIEFRTLNEEAYRNSPKHKGPPDLKGRDKPLDDRGVSIHVMATDGERTEYLRFDCFNDDPHYHYIFPEQKAQDWIPLDTVAHGEALPWALECIRTRLPAMLERAGAADLASKVDQRKIEAVLPRLARAAQDALERSPSRQQESG